MNCCLCRRIYAKLSVIVTALVVCVYFWPLPYIHWLNLTTSPNKSVEAWSCGGLGNQLFEYWGAKVYAYKKNKIITFDGFEDLKNILDTTWIESRDTVFAYSQLSKKKRILLRQKEGYFFQRVSANEDFMRIGAYMQDYENLAGYADVIRKETVFKHKFSLQNQVLVDKMAKENAISIHVRRGDYAWSQYTLLSPEWYEKAIAYMNKRVKNPVYYIFSDDIFWAKHNLKIDAPHMFVTWNRGAESYNDMRLMMHCKHNIIANSTFSWWGAFLGNPRGRIVIMPNKWIPWNPGWEDSLIVPGWVVLPVD